MCHDLRKFLLLILENRRITQRTSGTINHIQEIQLSRDENMNSFMCDKFTLKE